ncbi:MULTISPECIES: hypothetical protein [Vibrio]|uniref:Uncharacterized protein n=1 Tax=Vibrio kanaloae TaxID=170673 RepID=A0ABV4LKM6_9VIBR|nr:hypothetical protein [Vibrio kanaloae]EJE4163733.1 hypothetical protein [Vibrio parahaemolyticus]OEF14261.1 hypothetical protein A132_10080 [Vibrio kanaloae 5S-149]
MNFKLTINEKLTLMVAIFSLGIAGYSLYISLQAKTTKLSIETEKTTCSGEKDCYKVFVFNNDEAPCFDFSLSYGEELGQGYYMQGYEKSSLFNSNITSKTISFPAMTMVPLNKHNGKAWLGFLDNKQIAHFSFIPLKPHSSSSTLKVTCAGFEESVSL